METNPRRKHSWLAVEAGLIFLFVVLSCLVNFQAAFHFAFGDPEVIAARSTETALTAAHGIEAQRAIQMFIDTSGSLDTFRNPQLLSKVEIGQALATSQALKQNWSSKTIDILKSSTINKVRVIDYSPTQFKAFSCQQLTIETVTLDGTYVSSYEPRTYFAIYVFKLDDGVWKMAASADFSDADHIERDWTEGMYPQWDIDLVGDLPHLIDIYDSCFS